LKKNLFNFRSFIAFAHDLTAAVIAWCAAFLLRFNFEIPSEHHTLMIQMFVIVVPLQAIFFLSFGLYLSTWRFASMPDLKRIILTVIISAIALVAILFMVSNKLKVPRSILILDPIILILIMGGSRFIYRSIREHKLYGGFLQKGEPVIIIGRGEATISLIKDLAQSSEWRALGILDDDETMHGREILGIKVLGNIKSLSKAVNNFRVGRVIIVMASLLHQERRKALDLANHLDLEAFTVPVIDDLISGRLNISKIRIKDLPQSTRSDHRYPKK
jgi:FlaA1/EpsC-like NDP-sugar epimerase